MAFDWFCPLEKNTNGHLGQTCPLKRPTPIVKSERTFLHKDDACRISTKVSLFSHPTILEVTSTTCHLNPYLSMLACWHIRERKRLPETRRRAKRGLSKHWVRREGLSTVQTQWQLCAIATPVLLCTGQQREQESGFCWIRNQSPSHSNHCQQESASLGTFMKLPVPSRTGPLLSQLTP